MNDDDESLPSHIRYKIRMEVGRVDGTARKKVKWRCVLYWMYIHVSSVNAHVWDCVLLSGIVFDIPSDSTDENLPSHVKFRIRMDTARSDTTYNYDVKDRLGSDWAFV